MAVEASSSRLVTLPSVRTVCSPAPERGSPAGLVEIERLELLRHLGCGGAEREQAIRVEAHPDLLVDAAGARDLRDAFRRQHRLGDVIVDEPAHLVRRHGGRVDDEGEDGVVGGIQPLHDRLVRIRRQVAGDGGDGVAHIVGGAVDIDADGELDRDGRRALGQRGAGCARHCRGRRRHPRRCARPASPVRSAPPRAASR